MVKTLLRLALCIIVAVGSLTANGNENGDVSGQYWFDSGGEHFTFIPGSFEITTDGLTEGFHTLHAYITNGDDISATHSAWFLKQSNKLEENEQLKCTFYIDGQLYGEQNVEVGAGGVIPLDLDINDVSLGMHTLGVVLSDADGNSLGCRNGMFMRIPTDLQKSTFNAYYYLDDQYMGELPTSGNQPITHLDIDASALESGLHSLTVYIASPHGMATQAKAAWFIKIPKEGEGIKKYSYWLNDDETAVQTVELEEVANPYKVLELINVPERPFRSKSYTFAIEKGSPVFYACNDFKICFTDPDDRVSTASRTYTDVRVKTVPNEISVLEGNKEISTGELSLNEVKLYKFDAEIGDSINLRVDRAAMLELYSPTGETLVKVNGIEATQNNTLTVRQNGTHYIAIHDIALSDCANVDFNHIHRFAILEQEINKTANRGCFEMEIKGNGFESLQNLSFAGNGNEIAIDQYKVIDNYTLCAMIDFESKIIEPGEYRLKGSFKGAEDNSSEEILSSMPMSLEDPTPVEIDVEIEAPGIINTPYLAYIKVSNRSNVGVWGIPFDIAAEHTPNGGKIEFMDFEIVMDKKFCDSIPFVHLTEDLLNTGKSGSFAQTVIPYLAPGETKTYTIGLTTAPHEIVTLYAWSGKPWSEEIYEMNTGDYDPTIIQQPFEGNLFTFTEFSKLYYQLINGIYHTDTSADMVMTQNSNGPLMAPQPPLRLRNTANAAAGTAKQSVGTAARSSNNAIGIRMTGREMLLQMNGPQADVQQMQDTDRGMLMVGNDLMAAADTENNAIGNAEALGHLMNARNHWRNSVPPNPNPTPHPTESYQSGDPNDMMGYLSPAGTNHVGIDVKKLSYTIEFENDPEIANAPASNIKVSTHIDGSVFDLSSLKTTTLKIGEKEIKLPGRHHFVKTIDMRSDINAIAELTFDFDAKTGVAEWRLRSLDPQTLDDAKYMNQGILPVNDDSGRGIGYLTFSVDLLPTVSDNTEIESSAEIIFDDNEAISTPVWTNVTDYTVPTATIVSQTTSDNKTFDFTVEGDDSGSGIWAYDLYMSSGDTKNKKWNAVKTHIENNTFSYTSPIEIENPGFAVLATDRAGNRQSEVYLNILEGDADGNGFVDANDVVAARNYYLGHKIDINLSNADVNHDGVTDTQDATAIINLYLDNIVAKSKKMIHIK